MNCRCAGRRGVLIDNNLSPVPVEHFRAGGNEAVHVRTYTLQSAPDEVVLHRARDEGRVLISADTDFGALLARQHADRPSVLLLRHATPRRAVNQARLILANLPAIEDDLTAARS